MSDPIRYDFIYNENYASVEREEHKEGDYVSYEDYARLKAAFDLLDESIKLGPSTIPLSSGCYIWKESEQYALKEENARLKAEVEWLNEFYTLSITPNRELKAEIERLKEFISKIPAEARIKVVTDAHKGRWAGCPPSDEYVGQLRGNAAEEGKQP